MVAVIVPGVTDLNKGDQALVWESYRLVRDTGLFDSVYLLTNGDTEEEKEKLCGQSKKKGYQFINHLLKHPRRGTHKKGEDITESYLSLIYQVSFAFFDLLSRSFLLLICSNLTLVKIFFNEEVYESVKKLQEVDAFFVKGGGFIHSYGEKKAPYLIWYFLFYIRLAQRLKKKIVILPNSFGPFEGLTVKFQVYSVLRMVDLIYAREEISSAKLAKLLDRQIPVELDLGFFLKSNNDAICKKLLQKYGLKESDKKVGITVRPWRFPGKLDSELLYENYLSSITKFVEHLITQNYKVVFCNQSLGPNVHEDDRNAIERIFQEFENKNVVWIDENLSCKELKNLYSNFYFLIGTRFHSVIFSLSSQIPSIAVGYGGNKSGIMQDFGIGNLTVPIDNISADKLIEMFNYANSNYDIIKNNLLKKNAVIINSRDKIISDIRSLYN